MESHLAALFHPPSRIFETFKPATLDTLSEENKKKKGNFAKKLPNMVFSISFLEPIGS